MSDHTIHDERRAGLLDVRWTVEARVEVVFDVWAKSKHNARSVARDHLAALSVEVPGVEVDVTERTLEDVEEG